MNSKLYPGPRFLEAVKKLSKKYPSFPDDLATLLSSLRENPIQGRSLGRGNYKIRLAIKSKRQGKSGGARVITHVDLIVKSSQYTSVVDLIMVYDKANVDTVSTADVTAWTTEVISLREEE